MKKTMIGLVAVAALGMMAGGALAADLSGKAPKGGSIKDAPAPAAECCQANWNGIYIGGGIGYAGLVADHNDDFAIPAGAVRNQAEIGSDGFLGFIRMGLDRQVGEGIVMGLFAEYEFDDLGIGSSSSNSSKRKGRYKYYNVNNDVFEHGFDLDNSWAIGARLGFVRSCCTMWYLTGGYTQSEISNTFTRNDVAVAGTINGGKYAGWFIGGGVEQQLGRGLSLMLEYRYAHLEDKLIFDGTNDITGLALAHRETLDPAIHSVQLGVNYKFDLGGHRTLAPLK